MPTKKKLMKKFILLFVIISMLSFTASAQDSAFTIKGNLEKIKSGVIYLSIYQDAKTLKDSTTIKDGNFQFSGFVTAPFFASLTMPEKQDDYFTFYVEPANMLISGRADSLKLLSVKGSQVNDDDKMLKERLKTVSKWESTNSKIYEAAYKEKNKQVMDSLDEIDNKILLEKRNVVAGFVKDHPSSLRAAMAINENFRYYAEASDVEPLYNYLDEKIKNSAKGKEIKHMIDVYSAVAVGKKAPDIVQFTPDSNQLSLSSLKGKYVLVDFWASWCGPCRRENPSIVSAYNQYKDQGFTVFGVSYDSKKDRWLKAIKDDQLNWYQVSDLQGWKNATSDQYGIKAIPSNLLLDKDGIIVAKNIFGENLVNKLAELLNSKPSKL